MQHAIHQVRYWCATRRLVERVRLLAESEEDRDLLGPRFNAGVASTEKVWGGRESNENWGDGGALKDDWGGREAPTEEEVEKREQTRRMFSRTPDANIPKPRLRHRGVGPKDELTGAPLSLRSVGQLHCLPP